MQTMSDNYLANDTGPFVMIPLWIVDKFSPMEVRVYAFVAAHADNLTGELYAGHKRLAAEAGIHRDTVRKAIKSLEAGGALESCRRQREDGFRTSNETRLTTSAPAGWINPLQRERVKSDTPNDDLAGLSSAPSGSIDPDLAGPQTRAELDSGELDPENKRNLSDSSSLRRHSVKRKTPIGVPAELREACQEFIDQYREWCPDLRDELPEEIQRVYADVVTKRDVDPTQIMAKLELYSRAKVRRGHETDDWFEEDFRKPTNFLRHEVQPGIDYAGVRVLGQGERRSAA